MLGQLVDLNIIAIVVFGCAIGAILFRWLVLTEDRRKYRDYVDGGLWAWVAFSTALYAGEAHALGHDGFGGDGFDVAGGGDGGGCGGGCGGGT